MILPIYVYGHPVLRKKTENVSLWNDELKVLVENMFETMYRSSGVGLAAPQVGQALRLFVIDTEAYLEAYPNTEVIKEAFINPEIMEEAGTEFAYSEGCLSIPDVHADVVRKPIIKVKYTDLEGKEHIRTFEGMAARTFQHEYDHLEGKIFIDHLPSLTKMLLKRKLTDIASGKHKPFYKSINK